MVVSQKRMMLIINPNSKPLKVALFLQMIISKFEKGGYTVDLFKTHGEGDATRIAHEAALSNKYEIVVAGGGDGTVNEVLNGLMPQPCKMGILPLGTSNVLCRSLNLPLNPLKAADAILSGRSKKIDLGQANDRYFAIMVSCGYDAYAIEQTSLRAKRFTGKYAYIYAGIKSIYHYQPQRIYLISDGKPVSYNAMVIVVSNAHLYGGNYRLTPDAQIDDGVFDVFIYTGNNVYRFLYYCVRLLFRHPVEVRDAVRTRVRNLQLTSPGRVLYQGDGDLFGKLPLTIRILPAVLEIAGVKLHKAKSTLFNDLTRLRFFNAKRPVVNNTL